MAAMRPTTSRAIAERAHEQLGLVTRPQLTDLGVSAKVIRSLPASGYVPVGRHTFRLPGVAPTFEGEVMAACLDTGGVASHRTSARLLALGRDLHGCAVEVVVTRAGNRAPRPGWIVHSTTHLPAADLLHVGPIPCVGVARTFLMLAALVPEVSAGAIRTAIGDAAREGRVSDAWLWWRLEQIRGRGRGGVTQMEAILRRRQRLGPTESWLEHTFLDLLEAAGLALPVVQARIARNGSFVARVDCFFADIGLVVELEGHRPHRDQRRRDEVRRRQLVLAGVQVMVVTYDELVADPGAVLADIAAALGRGAAA